MIVEPNEVVKPGDILAATDRRLIAGYHYIIHVEDFQDQSFVGAMLTSSSRGDNVRIEPDMFETHSEEGIEYPIPSKPSYVVQAKLIKLNAWGPFKVVGKLTNDGRLFVIELINALQPETWEHYKRRSRNSGRRAS